MDRALAVHSSFQDCGRILCYCGGLFIDKAALESPSGGGSQQAGSNTAFESFWRCIFVKILLFLWSMGVPGGPRGVPGGSQGRDRRSQGRPQESQGRAHRIPCIPGGSGDVPGIPRILFIKMIRQYDSII